MNTFRNILFDTWTTVGIVMLVGLVLFAVIYGVGLFLGDLNSGRYSRKPKDPKEGDIYTSRDMPGHEAEVVRTDDGVVHFRCGRAMHCHTVQQFHQFYVKLRDRMTP